MSRRHDTGPFPGDESEESHKKRRLSFDLEPSIPSHQRAIEFFESLPHGYMKKFVVAVAMSFDHLHPKEIKKMLDRLSDVSPLPLPSPPVNESASNVSGRAGASIDNFPSSPTENSVEAPELALEIQPQPRKRTVTGNLFKGG